ncbi:hypothetical protein ATX33_10665 [Oenococcus oeni]|nr:hypothetical protein ATX33_10665 [Oenococcus oeni]
MPNTSDHDVVGKHIVIACIRHLFVLIQPDKVDIEIIHKKLLTVIGSAERPFGYLTALVHK